MKKFNLMLIFVLTALLGFGQKSFYDFTVKDIEGNNFDMANLKGQKVLVVNTASKCGLTPQYEALEALYKKYGGEKFVIIGFPANNFLSQEPGSNDEIAEFCQRNYGVSFPMMAKISVKGSDMAPIYHWLTEKSLNGLEDSSVAWNFQKYMIDENGRLVGSVSPKTAPDSPKIVSWIEGK
ncbi:glutathione peroxidase [Mangrovibacterium marinum]|uniref:Glutathione peroxidase n=1 Tax=Mangrovibacterium marinum TaxID=1639118 RepID=A0A2T5C326_9BACT|nr:glutathione peroxidase [Mangrovibacterium marinum]PTN09162.1 glutathione peroxidase [Mangrovibacterium marinum]